ncbi:MAG: hypothetical protein FJ319_14405 [SAR202 cluster bacterium]|nr:hypothetical protein [SAR202 cluster bacterium]
MSPRTLPQTPTAQRQQRRIAYLESESAYVNLAGEYDYLTSPYYDSQDLENAGKKVYPACKDTLDAYVVPLFLEKAKLAGLPVPTFFITNDYFEPPALVDTVNPYMSTQSIVRKPQQRDAICMSMTRNHTYAICCQVLTETSRVGQFRMVLGKCSTPKYRPLAETIWKVFRIPIATIRIITESDGTAMVSAMRPLPYASLSAAELAVVEKAVTWRT